MTNTSESGRIPDVTESVGEKRLSTERRTDDLVRVVICSYDLREGGSLSIGNEGREKDIGDGIKRREDTSKEEAKYLQLMW